jgi:serine/threonine protein kinase/beta-lactam-binding protein with PASTA domain
VQPDGRADGGAQTGGHGGSIDPLIGRTLEGRYAISGRIARGGMASVYEATDIRLDRTVAIKVMHAGLGDDGEFAARFVREARAAARLSHPNVVAVYDQGDDAGTVFLAMELIPGHTLRDTIAKESPMSPAKALSLMEPVLSALAAAHRAGLIHRDVKPENVLIADDGRIKVADFGLAKAISADTQHTATQGVLIGTVSYLAPELVVEGRADARADVYAAGVLLYELLTGKKPHEGETPIQVAYKHVHNDVPPPSELVPDLPEYVDALVARATARDRSLRPADAGVLLHQVHRVSHALDNGVRHDPELTQDLAPLLVAGSVDTDGYTDTAPEMWDQAEMEALMSPPMSPPPPPQQRWEPEHTSMYPAAKPPPASPPPNAHPAPSPGRPRRSKRGPVLLALSLILVLAIAAFVVWFTVLRYTTTPAVILLPQAQAEQKLEAAGLDVEYADAAFSETVPKGQVISTDPGAGDRIVENGTVTVTVSLGAERYEVPKVKGMSEDQAQDALLELKLSFDRSILRYSEKIPEGTVIGSDPPVGTVLRPGASVDLIVSKGRRPITVGESWVGKSIDEMTAQLEGKGLKVTVVAQEFSDTIDEGDVISYRPNEGTLFRGEEVEVTVSKGPELIEVPGVIGSGLEAAVAELEGAGFEVNVEESGQFIGLNYVLDQDPGSGDLAPRGSTITIYLV